jgi:proteasome lid subunit RPN8/RPN11
MATSVPYSKLKNYSDDAWSGTYHLVKALEELIDKNDEFPENDSELNDILQEAREALKSMNEIDHIFINLERAGFKEPKFSEPDHKRILSDLKKLLDFLKTNSPAHYSLLEVKLKELLAQFAQLGKQAFVSEHPWFSECPVIPEAQEMIERSKKYMAEKHPSDTNDAEVASKGHNYTYHTHPRGTPTPSEPDLATTKALGKQYLCIGQVPQNKVICYDMNTGGVSCEHPA